MLWEEGRKVTEGGERLGRIQEVVATEQGFDKWVGFESCGNGKGGLEDSLGRDRSLSTGWRSRGGGVMGLVLFA